MPHKTIAQLAAEKYDDPELIQAVLEDARKLHNVEKIEAGELVLPHPHDARTWHDRITGKVPLPGAETPAADVIRSLLQRVKTLEAEKEKKR